MDRRGDEVRRRAGRSGAKTSKEGRRAKDMPGDAHAEGAEFRSRRGRSRESPPWLFLRFQESGRPPMEPKNTNLYYFSGIFHWTSYDLL